MQVNQWHFPRPALAQAYLDSFELGLSSARGLFARRRMGKTEFLVQDLMPAAQKEGYVPIYVNLWEEKANPARAILAAFVTGTAATGMQKLIAALQTPIKSVKASAKAANLGEAGIEAEFGDTKSSYAGSLLRDAMEAFDKTKKKVLLIIDEAQVLAHEDNSEFAHALRAALDIRKEHIKVIFAGSSESTLRRMFGRTSEPFYNWAVLEPFPLLKDDFVEAMVKKVAAISRAPLSLEDAKNAYSELHNTPLFFRNYLDRYLTHPFDGPQGALDYTKSTVFNDDSFQRHWDEMLPADRAVLKEVVRGIKDIFGKAARTSIADHLGVESPVPMSTVQNSLRRLDKNNIVTKLDTGNYQLEDQAFEQWIREIEE